jgi:glycosyltransferase involved in cell wall biosynthesis
LYRIAFVSREVSPFPPLSGLGAYVHATAGVLAADAEVTIVTSDRHEELYEALGGEASPDLPEGVRFAFVREPSADEAEDYFGPGQLWSARAFEKLKELYPDGGPDVAEFPDYLGEGAVTVQARNTLDPGLRNTLVCIRLHTSEEIRNLLNGRVSSELGTRVACDLERYALAHADRVLWPGGDVLEAYRRYYDGAVARPERIRPAVRLTPPGDRTRTERDGRVRLLYAGRLERRKGVQNLCRALTGLGREDWHLTLVGGDTPTAPLASSMLAQLRLATADDERFELRDEISRDEVLQLMADSDLLISPSLWECWPNVVLEALSQSLPVLATPVGGHVELVDAGTTGWLASGRDEADIATALEQILDRRDEASALAEGGRPRRRFEELTSPEAVRESYREVAGQGARRAPPRPDSRALVSVVVPYFSLEEHLVETLESVRAQTYPQLEVIVVNDGSFRDQDSRVLDAATDRFGATVLTQQNSGLGRARNFAISQSRGRYVLPLDPDDLLEPRYVERCADVLESRPELAYVNTWSRYVNEDGSAYGAPSAGYRPFSNEAVALGARNVAGPATALIRRDVFDRGFRYSLDLTSYEDWLFYQELAAAGLVGHTIPEQLFVYRVRSSSMFRTVAEGQHDRLMEEMAGHRRERGTQWTPGDHPAPSNRRSKPAPADTADPRRLEQANRELRVTNARLARSRWAKADSAAATLVARLELERQELEERRLHESYDRQAHRRRIEELQEWALDLERQLKEITATRTWRLATRYWRSREAMKRALLRRGGP